MNGRKLTTGATLVVLVVVLCVMAVWGYNAATAPVDDETPTASGPTCAPEDQTTTGVVRRGDVTVSVYNAGQRSGGAQDTLDLLESAGFRAGEVSNAPDGIEVAKAAVYTTKADDPAAELVARTLGPKTQVVRSDAEFGPGVAVVIGDKFRQLDASAPRRIEYTLPEPVCE
jgi:hypothetical protein